MADVDLIQRACVPLLAGLLILGAPGTIAQGDPDPMEAPATAVEAFQDLVAQARQGIEPDQAPLERMQQEVFPTTEAHQGGLEDAWRAVSEREHTSLDERLSRAELALTLFTFDASSRAATAGDTALAAAWLELPWSRISGEARATPTLEPSEGRAPVEPAEEHKTALVAIRARELVVQGLAFHLEGADGAARTSADAARPWLQTLAPTVERSLPTGMAEAFKTNLSTVHKAIRNVERQAPGTHALAGLLAPLTALEYQHDVEPLEVQASRNVDAALISARALREDPGRASALVNGTLSLYAADRPGIQLQGEGSLDNVTEAYGDLVEAVQASQSERADDAAGTIRDGLAEVALLGYGVVLKLETGAVQPDREHTYRLTLVRPSLEGVERVRLTVRYDPGVVRLTDVELAPRLNGTVEAASETGRLSLAATFEEPLVRSARIALVTIVATGEPGSQTELTLTDVEVQEPDEDILELYRLRHGSATVAEIHRGEGPNGTDGELGDPSSGEDRSIPAPGLAAALVTASLATAWRRRHR